MCINVRWLAADVASEEKKMKFAVTLFGLCAFNVAMLHGEDTTMTKCRANEVFSECGNLCEDTCFNCCDRSQVLPFRQMTMASNVECARGCYCASGFIRNDFGECVVNRPGVCGGSLDVLDQVMIHLFLISDDKRCASVSPHAIYKRCSHDSMSTCFKSVTRTAAYLGRCECMPGYSMNLNRKCVPTTECDEDEYDQVAELYLPTPNNC
jgi:Trypsin Inhibitor like cysteine rich domain